MAQSIEHMTEHSSIDLSMHDYVTARQRAPRPDDFSDGDSARHVVDEGPLGMNCDVKQLYKDDIGRHSWWTDRLPLRADISTSEYAVVVRNVFNDFDEPGDSRIRMHSVVIQSPLLRKILQDLLEGYPGVALKSERLTFTVPFQPLVHRWGAVKSASKSESNPETVSHLQLLISTLETAVDASLRSVKEFHEHHEITFQHLWTIFIPKDLVYTIVDNSECALRLKKTEYISVQGQKFLMLHCQYVDWDGNRFGSSSKELFISEYSGSAGLADLPTYPMKYHGDEGLKERLQQRGRKFETFKGFHYVAYEGVALNTLGEKPQPCHVRLRQYSVVHMLTKKLRYKAVLS
jgi:hypothetical protein